MKERFPEQMLAELAKAAENRVDQLEQLQAVRCTILIGQVIDGLSYLTRAAESDVSARHSLKQFVDALDKARALVAGIVLP